MDLDRVTADDIMAIPANRPDRLYSNDLEKAKSEFHALAMRFHPDRDPSNKRLNDVLFHIKTLYESAKTRIGTSSWDLAFKFILHRDGKTIQRGYRSKHTFELGEMYVGDVSITYVVKPEFEEFFNNARYIIGSITYPNDDIRKQFQPLMPTIETWFKAEEGLVLVLKKTTDVVSLRDVSNHLGTMDDRHVAWIYGRLCNLCCFLQHAAKITHNSINPDTLFISPPYHSVSLLGGWWYASRDSSKKLLGLPQYSVTHGYPSIMRTKMPDNKNDLTLIKAVARELLGDVFGSKLRLDKNLRPGLATWFNQPTIGVAVKEYAAWEKVRDTGFGPRKFVRLELTTKDLYPDSF